MPEMRLTHAVLTMQPTTTKPSTFWAFSMWAAASAFAALAAFEQVRQI